ncbi:MAG: HU family DNA-binding protein [Bacteroidota bacterium]
MRKIDMIEAIHDKTGIPKVDVLVTLETFFTEVKQTVFLGEIVSIRGFGSFAVLKRRAKIGRNISAKTSLEIPEHYIPKFKPAKEFMVAMRSVKVK